MKKIFYILATVFSLISSLEINAQYCGAATTNTAITPTTTAQLSASFNTGRRAFNFAATAGCTYVFETCGLSTADTYLRLYSTATGGTLLATGDDNCGTQSRITWTCVTSGNYSILMTNYTCANLNVATRLRYSISGCTTTPYNPCTTIPTIAGCGTSASAAMTGTGAGWSVTSCGYATPGQERLFQFTAPTTGTYTLNVSAITGGYVDFFWKPASGGCNATGWNCIDDIFSVGTYAAIAPMTFTAGTTYYILLDPEGTGTFNTTFNLVCPAAAVANDLVCNATAISCGQTLNGTTVGANNAGTGENLTCGTNQTMPGVWYVVPGNGQIMTASLCGTVWDSKISVFNGTNCSALTCIGGVDDAGPACPTTSASFSWTSVVGQNYYILVHGYSTNQAFSLALTCTSPPPANPTGINSSNASICSGAGTNVTLTAAGAVGTVYWFAGSCATTGQIGTGNSISVSPSSTTTYFARNFNGSAFSTNCASYTVQVVNAPTINAGTGSTICEGNLAQLNATSQVQSNGTLNTIFLGGNGCGAGNMFDLVAGSNQVTVNGFTLNPSVAGAQTVNVYYLVGSYVPNTNNAAAWTLLGAYAINATAAATPTFMPTANLVIPAGATYGIYVQYNANYTDGNGTNQVYANADLTLNAGIGHCAAFDACCSPRVFNGTVHYTVGVNPTISWSPSASLSNATILNPVASPTTTTTYTVTASINGCSANSQVTVNVNSVSTEPTLSGAGLTCPNTTVNLVASGGTAGTGSQVAWYTGPNGTGSFLGFGNSFSFLPASSSTVYARREGTCNTSADAQTSITLRDYVYAANNISSTNYCTDNSGWNHFYNGNDIILSVRGDLSTAGTVTALIRDNATYFTALGNTALCASGINPGEAQFEMQRSWNVSYTGTLSGTYQVRYYFNPQERQDVIDAAAAYMAANPSCAYNYKYNAVNSGWFWFKNNNVTYTAPSFDDNPNFALLTSTAPGTTANGLVYTEISNITGFSGGTGGVVLLPGGFLPVEWLYFNVENQGNANRLLWATASEENALSFEVQRSVNGSTFEKIGTKAAAGNSTVTNYYEFMDNNPQNGLNYYRIKLINTDGTEEFTEIKVIENTFAVDFSVYPNPSSDIIHFNSTTDKVEDIKVEILDILGRVVKTEIHKSVIGKNNVPLRIAELQSGSYSLRATFLQSNKTNSAKFVKK
jgi:hypothetical protein